MTRRHTTWIAGGIALLGVAWATTDAAARWPHGGFHRTGRYFNDGHLRRPSKVREYDRYHKYARNDYYYYSAWRYNAWPGWGISVPLTDGSKPPAPPPRPNPVQRSVAEPHDLALGIRGPRAGTSSLMLGSRHGQGPILRGPHGRSALRALPEPCTPLEHDGTTYYHCGQEFYVGASFGGVEMYLVGAPPVGAAIESLSSDSSTREMAGQTYHIDGSVYYLQEQQAGRGVFVVVEPPAAAAPPKPSADAPIDPYGVLNAMGSLLTRTPAFSFKFVDQADEAQSTGGVAQLGSRGAVQVVRPDRLHVDITGDGIDRRAWYDGASVTILDRATHTYGTVDAPATIDDMLDLLASTYTVSLPLTDFLYADVFATLASWAEAGFYLGRATIDGLPCEHLLFVHPAADWQIWIQANGPPVPRRLTIIFKTGDQTPRYSATFSDWDLAPQFSPDTFSPAVETAERVPLRRAP